MRIKIRDIVPNPFRNFDIDPIDQHQVDRLSKSIDDLGFFSGITVRKGDGVYETAAGHHRVIAAEQAGLDAVEAVVGDYDDEQMVRIMAIENLTQRGSNTGAQMDAVAAMAGIVAYEVLTDREGSSKIFEEPHQPGVLTSLRSRILSNGPGEWSIYEAINGFPRDEAKERKNEDKRAEMISSGDIRKALQNLKDSGIMGAIVAKVYAKVEKEREEDAAKAEEERRRVEAKAKAEAERLAAASEAKRRAEAEAFEKAKRAAEAAKEAERLKAADAARRKAEAEAAELARSKAMAERRKAEEKQAAQRKATAEVEAQRQKEAAAKAKKEAEEADRVRAQKEQEKIYDIRCNAVFPDPSYAEVFRKAVVERGSRAVISRDDQLGHAKRIVEEMKKLEGGNYKLGTGYINQYINEVIADHDAEERRDAETRRAALAKMQIRMRVDKLWDDVKRASVSLEISMNELAKEHAKWNTKVDGDFPRPSLDMTTTIGILAKIEKMLKRMYGGVFGVPKEEEARVEPEQKLIANK